MSKARRAHASTLAETKHSGSANDGGEHVGDGETAVVDVRELTKRYGKFVALDRLTLSVGRGQILGFIGPNGAGKTTTIKILVGLARPTGGTATVAGIDCVRYPRKLKRLV